MMPPIVYTPPAAPGERGTLTIGGERYACGARLPVDGDFRTDGTAGTAGRCPACVAAVGAP